MARMTTSRRSTSPSPGTPRWRCRSGTQGSPGELDCAPRPDHGWATGYPPEHRHGYRHLGLPSQRRRAVVGQGEEDPAPGTPPRVVEVVPDVRAHLVAE